MIESRASIEILRVRLVHPCIHILNGACGSVWLGRQEIGAFSDAMIQEIGNVVIQLCKIKGDVFFLVFEAKRSSFNQEGPCAHQT